jgi:flagellum-specific peptidoglycan hydrolase FlgJ
MTVQRGCSFSAEHVHNTNNGARRMMASKTCDSLNRLNTVPGYVGIRGTGPAGSYNAQTKEFVSGAEVQMMGNFRAYHSYSDFYADYANLICKGSRYAKARGKKGREYYEALKQGGYTTTAKYADYIMPIYGQLGCK